MVVHARRSRVFRLDLGLLLRPGLRTVKQFIRDGSPVVCNETMWGLGTAIFPTIMGHMAGSTEILAAYTIAGNVEKLCMVVAFGISGTASIIIGREIGAGRSDTVYQVGLALNTLAAAGGTILGAALLAFTHLSAPAWFFPLFHLSPSACSAATIMMTVQACIMPMYFKLQHRRCPPGRRRCEGGHHDLTCVLCGCAPFLWPPWPGWCSSSISCELTWP